MAADISGFENIGSEELNRAGRCPIDEWRLYKCGGAIFLGAINQPAHYLKVVRATPARILQAAGFVADR